MYLIRFDNLKLFIFLILYLGLCFMNHGRYASVDCINVEIYPTTTCRHLKQIILSNVNDHFKTETQNYVQTVTINVTMIMFN